MKARFNRFADWFGLTLVALAIVGAVVGSVGYLAAMLVRAVVEAAS